MRSGAPIDPDEPLRDVHWLSPEGDEMAGHHWGDDGLRVFGMQIGNDRVAADRLLILFNGGEGEVAFRLAPIVGGPWTPALDTTRPTGTPDPEAPVCPVGGAIPLPGRSVLVMTAPGTFQASAAGPG